MRKDIPHAERTYLAAPHAERHEAKALVARWDTDFNDLAIQNPELVSRQLDDVLHGVKEQGLAASQSIELAPAV